MMFYKLKMKTSKLLAAALAVAIVLSVVPFSLVTGFAETGSEAEKPEKFGTLSTITGGSVANANGSDAVATFAGLTLEWSEANPAAGRNVAGWWVGIKMTAPADMKAETDFTGVTYQRGLAGENWTDGISFWDAQDSDKTAESTERYLTMWGLVNEQYLNDAKATGTTINFAWQFDWNADGSTYEQKATIKVDPTNIILNKEGNQIYPVASGLGTVNAISDGVTIDGSGSNIVTATNINTTTITKSPANSGIGRNEEGWWIGIDVIAPADADLDNAKYQNKTSAGWGTAKDFKGNNDTETSIQLWGLLNEEYLTAALANGKNVNYVWRFDWDGDGSYEQLITIKVDPKKVVLKNEDGSQVYPYLGTVTPLTGGTVSEDAFDLTLTIKDTTLNWSPKNDDRAVDGWWVGMKVTAPEACTEEMLEKATYKRSVTVSGGTAWSEATTVNFKDVRDAEDHVQTWMVINPDLLATYKGNGKNISTKFVFDWNGDQLDDQTITLSVDPTGSITFNKGEQTVALKDVPTEALTYGVAPFTVGAEGSTTELENKYEFVIIDEACVDGDTTAGSVAKIDPVTGEVTVKAAGTFKITAKALAGQYYNESETVTSDVITVNRATVNPQISIDPANGQVRPNGIEISLIGIPSDADGTVTITAKNDKGETVGKAIVIKPSDRAAFNAQNADNNYKFIAEYSGDEKYAEATATADYSFTKGDQTDVAVTVDKNTITFAEGATIQATATNGKTGKYEYDIVDEVRVDGVTTADSVAKINPATGEIAIQAAGTFKVTVKALSDDDYNESAVVTSETITVNRAEQAELSFVTGESTVTYFHGFTYIRGLGKTGTGSGEITYALGNHTAAGVAVDSATGAITFTDGANDNSSAFQGSAGTVEVVVTKAADHQYNAKTASYTIDITKADQTTFEFAATAPEAITYTANNGTTYSNAISADDDKNGWVNVNNAPNYSIVEETALEGGAADVADIDAATGTIVAKRSGNIKVEATLAGNGVYNEIKTTYTITVNRGTVEGFAFAKPDSSIKYGTVGFDNVASGGQADTIKEVQYTENSEEVNADNGVISFIKVPAEAATETYNVTITATKPQTEKYLAKSITYTLTVTRDAVTKADFKVNGAEIKDATLLTSPDGWYNAAHDGITITPANGYTQISENGTDWSDKIERTDDQNHAIAFYLKDATGATTLISNQTVNYDKTPATAKLTVAEDGNFWTDFLEFITFGLWKNESKTVQIDAKDNLSGIASIEYYEQNDSFDQYTEDTIATAPFTWKAGTLTGDALTAGTTVDIQLDELTNKKVVIYAKVTDHAGNVSYFRTDGMVFDSITPDQETTLPTPIIDIQLSEGVTEGLYNAEVPFTLTVNDEQTDAVASGIKNIKVTIAGSEDEDYEKVINITAEGSEISSFDSADVNEDEFTVDNTFVVPAEFDSNYITILVEVEDYAGNKYTNEENLTHLAIDVTNPVIEVSYDDEEDTFSNGKYIGNGKNRVATIDITELNFDSSVVKITATRDGKALDIKPNFTAVDGAVDENGDQIGWQMQIDYASLGEGEFSFDIAYTDKAENQNDAVDYGDFANPQNFIIDNTKPVITVEISNTEVKNGKYFDADRTATVTIKERNFSESYLFDWSGLTLSLGGEALDAPTPKIEKSDDKTYERVYTIPFTAEGDYTFDVKYTDLADNVADTYTCTSVSYKEFTVDKTVPELSITGVKRSNNGTVAPVVSYKDINFYEQGVEIVLDGVNNGKNLGYAFSTENTVDGYLSGQIRTYANFEEVQKVDDIYTLTAKITDMAGNETPKTITFSANRFGSVYNLSEVQDILGKYLQTEQDIVFTETNVDTLEREGIKIKLTKNGTPTDLVEGTDYTVDAAVEEGQWSVYTYTVNKSLFADDGRYSLSIYSKDAAGNVNENIDEAKAAEISFGIDKTKPVIVPVDFESGVQYPVESKKVSVEIKDNLVLEGVKIYLNDKEIEYTVDGDTYTFDIPESNELQDVKIVAVDAAGNEYPITVEDFLVSTNIFVRWYNNTPLFIGSIIGVAVLALAIVLFIVFGKKKKKEEK